jgi:hypothetical protein
MWRLRATSILNLMCAKLPSNRIDELIEDTLLTSDERIAGTFPGWCRMRQR